MNQKINPREIGLVLVDLQNDFLPPTGSLAVPNGHQILPIVYQILKLNWNLIVVSQDYHPPNHISFASNHQQEPEFPPKIEPNSGITLWSIHCVQDTLGCEIENGVKKLISKTDSLVHFVKKGQDSKKEELSVFDGSGRLNEFLKSKNLSQLLCIGLAADYCLLSTVLSALHYGFEVFWMSSATKAVGGEEIQLQIESNLKRDYPKRFHIIQLEELLSL
ncbi:Isochorismatase-like protein [Melampsora americana]|nr:Isochorismatase-like protein [Melampsora americana]